MCSTGGACLTLWLDLQETSMVALKPTLFILDTPYQEHIAERSRSGSPTPLSLTADDHENDEEELYGLALLRRIISESYVRNAAKLVVTVPIVGFPYGDRPERDHDASDSWEQVGIDQLRLDPVENRRAANMRMLKKCLDLGATDVMTNPMHGNCVANLEVHAYRAHRDASLDQKAVLELRRGRKRSWVGISDEKPFAYLREAMVAKLMKWICRIGSETEDGLGSIKLSISFEKQAEVSSAVGQWHFCAHDFSDDELVVAASVMFKHALSMPEMEPWRIPTGTCRARVFDLCLLFADLSRSRPTVPLSSRLPRCLQRIRPLSQLPPRGRCSAGNLPLPCLHRIVAALPLCQRFAIPGPPEVTNRGSSTAV